MHKGIKIQRNVCKRRVRILRFFIWKEAKCQETTSTKDEGSKVEVFGKKDSNIDKSIHINTSKTYVIFIDSLDSSIFNSRDYLRKLPTLNKLYNSSLFFNNFTSSGF